MGSNNPVTDPYQAQFVVDVSHATKIDPRVVLAWTEQENADAPNGTGGFNYLNLRPEQGDPYAAVSSGGFEQFASEADAVTATVHRLGEPFAKPILTDVTKRTPRQEIAAIASTGWDSSGYGGPGGPKLAAKFADIFTPAGLDTSYTSPAEAKGIVDTAGTGSSYSGFGVGNFPIGHTTPGDVAGGIAHAIASPFELAGKIWDAISNPELWLRIGIGIAGVALIVLGAREGLI